MTGGNLQPLFDPASSVVTLRVLEGDFRGMLFVLPLGMSTIGRDPTCDFSMPVATMSRYHCSLHLTPQALTITDNNSTHGIGVNQQAVKHARLRPKDLVQLGDLQFMVELRAGCHWKAGPGILLPGSHRTDPALQPIEVALAAEETPRYPASAGLAPLMGSEVTGRVSLLPSRNDVLQDNFPTPAFPAPVLRPPDDSEVHAAPHLPGIPGQSRLAPSLPPRISSGSGNPHMVSGTGQKNAPLRYTPQSESAGGSESITKKIAGLFKR